MIENVTIAAKMKAVLSVLSILFLGGSLCEMFGAQDAQEIIPNGETKDTFTEDIQKRADLVNNAVIEAVNQQGKQSPLIYKQTCESVITTIRGERQDTEYKYNTLDASQKELVQEYRDYLQEAANAVIVCASGETPDLTKMDELKNKLN